MEPGNFPSIFVGLIVPAAILIGAVRFAADLRPKRIGRTRALVILAGSYPIWMFVWSAIVGAANGTFGKCGSSELSLGLAVLLVLPPSLLFCWGMGRAFRSQWMGAVPIGADAIILAATRWAESHGWTRMLAWDAFPLYGPVIWVGVIVATIAIWVAATPWPRPGVCQKCGYSLAGLPTGSRCPECGAGRRS